MATSFFGGEFFGGEFFNQGSGGRPRPDDGGRIFKPTGLIDRPKKPQTVVDQRVEDSSAIAAEVAAKLAREFGDETARTLAEQQALAVAELSAKQVDFEIGVLLRKKIKKDEEELLLILLLAASA